MNLTGKPVAPKEARTGRDSAYLGLVASLPCCICEAFGEMQLSPTQAHHCIHDRFSTRRTPDRMAIPLCEGHHQGLFDTSKLALHQSPQKWREAYGADHEWIAPTQDKIETEI